MKKVDMIVIAPHFYTLEGSGVGYLGDAAMVVDRGAIEALGPQEDMLSQYQAEQVLELPHHVVLPGLIDAHMHTDIGICRGLAQDTKHWMMYGMGPFDDALSRKEEILALVAKERGCLAKGGEADTARAAGLLLDDFRSGRLGRITLEFPEPEKEVQHGE